ncbi:MAG TPA: hypothetical protein ENN46_00265 [Candidatus Woesearchaeota archaeon]|nr:hypothetical protein [Candidatus Woesearchaeota archaeon]
MKSQLNISFNLVISVIIGLVVFTVVFRLGSSFFSMSNEAASLRLYSHFDILVRNLHLQADYTKKVPLTKSYNFFYDADSIFIRGLPQTINVRDSILVMPREFKSDSLVFFSRRSSFPLSQVDFVYVIPERRKFFIFKDRSDTNNYDIGDELFKFLPLRQAYNPVLGENEIILDKFFTDEIGLISSSCKTLYPCYVLFINKDPPGDLSGANAHIFKLEGSAGHGKLVLNSSGEEFYYFSRESLLAAVMLADKELYNKTLSKIGRLTTFNMGLKQDYFTNLGNINSGNSRCVSVLNNLIGLSHQINQAFSLFNQDPASNLDLLVDLQNSFEANLTGLDIHGCRK